MLRKISLLLHGIKTASEINFVTASANLQVFSCKTDKKPILSKECIMSVFLPGSSLDLDLKSRI